MANFNPPLYLILTYLLGSILQYFLWRLFLRRYLYWTKSDRIYHLTVGVICSWISVLLLILALLENNKRIYSDEIAEW